MVGFSAPDTFLVHASGEVTYAEAQQAIDSVLAHPAMGEHRKILVDGHSVTGAPTTAELRAIVRDMKPLFDRNVTQMAITTDKAFVYGVARMFGVFAEAFGLKVRAFRSLNEATEWLAGVGAPSADR